MASAYRNREYNYIICEFFKGYNLLSYRNEGAMYLRLLSQRTSDYVRFFKELDPKHREKLSALLFNYFFDKLIIDKKEAVD